MEKKTKRNAKIRKTYAKWLRGAPGGLSCVGLSRRYGVTVQRIWTIVKDARGI